VLENSDMVRAEDFAMTVDFRHANGTVVHRVLPFDMSPSMRDGWQQRHVHRTANPMPQGLCLMESCARRNYTYNATTPVTDVEVSLYFNGSSPGAVVFDDVAVTPLETAPGMGCITLLVS
jgi:hypothetical protein